MARMVARFGVLLFPLAMASACGSSSTDSVTVGLTESVEAKDFSCIHATPAAAPDELSTALIAACACVGPSVNIAGIPTKWEALDCSNSTLACVNGVLDRPGAGYRSSPWFATATTAFKPCATLAVFYDPCGGTCVTSPTLDAGSDADDDGDGDDDGNNCHNPNHHHHHHHGH